jgi:hypothetical protein
MVDGVLKNTRHALHAQDSCLMDNVVFAPKQREAQFRQVFGDPIARRVKEMFDMWEVGF